MNSNKNIIYIHIAKNGGTTMHSILDRVYSEDKVFDIIQDTSIDTDKFKNLSSLERENIKLLKGHLYFGLHKYLKGNSDYITFLRKPEERIISYYNYILTLPNHSLYKRMVNNNMSLMEFAEQMKHKDVNNAQINMISGINDSNELKLEKAIENIDKYFSFVGFQERYDESLVILKNLYNWKVPYYKKKNVNKKRKPKAFIDEKTMKVIKELNREDEILYNHCKEKFESQLAAVSNLEFELKRLKLYNKFYSSTKVKKINNKLVELRLKKNKI